MVSNWQVQQVARVVRGGGVIAYPTEAVWGLGCDPWNEEAVYRLLALKARPVEKGLILVADAIEQFDFLLDDLPDAWKETLAASWPGPNTWLVPHRDMLPEWITGKHDSVALRVSDHPWCAACAPKSARWSPRPPTPPDGLRRIAPARAAVLPRRAGCRAVRRPRWAPQPQHHPRPGHRAGRARFLIRAAARSNRECAGRPGRHGRERCRPVHNAGRSPPSVRRWRSSRTARRPWPAGSPGCRRSCQGGPGHVDRPLLRQHPRLTR